MPTPHQGSLPIGRGHRAGPHRLPSEGQHHITESHTERQAMSELTEERIRELVREEIAAELARQADAARTQLAAGLALLGRRTTTPALGKGADTTT